MKKLCTIARKGRSELEGPSRRFAKVRISEGSYRIVRPGDDPLVDARLDEEEEER